MLIIIVRVVTVRNTVSLTILEYNIEENEEALLENTENVSE